MDVITEGLRASEGKLKHLGLPEAPARSTRWYVAELVVRFDIESQPEYLFHVNALLLSAPSVEAAFEKAISIGSRQDIAFTNTDGEAVQSRFSGLRELFEIAGSLEDGCELFYEEIYRPREFQMEDLVKPKEKLAAFQGPSA